mmetsp:Transcript_45979/g.111385  ORF Transcript_45979/g.111385 Transcript_45979/m.111385 type:complete len:143 (+) Transcript_45979:1817-2245(+)
MIRFWLNSNTTSSQSSQLQNEYQDVAIYSTRYQLCDGQSLKPVWVIKRNVNDRSVTKVADLLGRIHVAESLQCRPRDLSLYAKGTTKENYKLRERLKISLPLSNSQVQETTEDDPLLVVVSAPQLDTVSTANVASKPQGSKL